MAGWLGGVLASGSSLPANCRVVCGVARESAARITIQVYAEQGYGEWALFDY